MRVKGKEEIISSSLEDGERFALNTDFVCRAFPIAVKTMKKGEKAQLTIAPECESLSPVLCTWLYCCTSCLRCSSAQAAVSHVCVAACGRWGHAA